MNNPNNTGSEDGEPNQDEARVSPEEAQLPDMVPVTIRSTTVPELVTFLQYTPLEKVLAGLLLTWEEFLQLFAVKLNPEHRYVIKGTNGETADLKSKIGDYVDTFKRRLKIYPVTIERVMDSDEKDMSYEDSNTTVTRNAVDVDTSAENEKIIASLTPKKFKLLDEVKRKRTTRMCMTKEPFESIEKVAHSVMCSQSALRRKTSTQKVDARRSGNKRRRSRSPVKDGNSDQTPSPPDSSALTIPSNIQIYSERIKVKRLTNDHRSSIDATTSNSSKCRNTRSKSGTSSRRNTKDLDEFEECSDTEDEEVPSKDVKKRLKRSVLKYLAEKVSPRSFLRLRNELMQLREQEKYFKVTSVVPITAGLMEQTFCRKISE